MLKRKGKPKRGIDSACVFRGRAISDGSAGGSSLTVLPLFPFFLLPKQPWLNPT